MSVYRDAFSINVNSPKARLELAAEMLASCEGVVLFQQTIALRTTPTCLRCEVVDPDPASRRCENEYEVLVENAQRMLNSSKLGTRLPAIPREWLVVDYSGAEIEELWRAR